MYCVHITCTVYTNDAHTTYTKASAVVTVSILYPLPVYPIDTIHITYALSYTYVHVHYSFETQYA